MTLDSFKREMRDDLSFRGKLLRTGRHRIHPYPAMLHPLLVDHLISRYAVKDSTILDPFCGSGVTLLQSSLNGHASIGLDINPLALAIARAKTASYDADLLKREFRGIRDCIFDSHPDDSDVPAIRNIEYWYKPDVIRDLGRLRFILQHNRLTYSDFFIVVFALIARTQSLTKSGEFKRYRIKGKKLLLAKNEVFSAFLSHCHKMVEAFTNGAQPLANSRPLYANSEDHFPQHLEYGTVITSPPYGDSRTTVAYGQFSSFGSDWIKGLEQISLYVNVDAAGLGKRSPLIDLSSFSVLSEILARIAEASEKRAKDVRYFFNGYFKALKRIVAQLADNGTICFVVGNRTVKDISIPLDQITASFLQTLGVSIDSILVRNIHNKVMPAVNSPTNERGKTSRTMHSEYIVIGVKR
ncbi:MAG: DNA methyltransferase [Chloroflexota bacterium]|nr:DNA methyltransferase [Chloroflexota bacterium]MDE2911198.1 DNA methyltransferase [Chloroflexota bacterium]